MKGIIQILIVLAMVSGIQASTKTENEPPNAKPALVEVRPITVEVAGPGKFTGGTPNLMKSTLAEYERQRAEGSQYRKAMFGGFGLEVAGVNLKFSSSRKKLYRPCGMIDCAHVPKR